VPLCINVEVRKFLNHIVDLPLQPSSTSHDLDLVEKTLERFMELRVNNNTSIAQDDTSIINHNLEFGS